MSVNQHEEFAAERALLNAELTALALAGSSTTKTREKIAGLDKREQTAREDEQAREQAAAAERRRQFEIESAHTAASLSTEALLRLTSDGFEVGENDAEKLALAAHNVVRFDADIADATFARDGAYHTATAISVRIDALDAHAKSLQDLRLTGQATPRDLSEAQIIALDRETLQRAFDSANAKAVALHVPAHFLEHRLKAMAQLTALEREIRKRICCDRLRAAEYEILQRARELRDEVGTASLAGVYLRSPQFDKYIRTGAL